MEKNIYDLFKKIGLSASIAMAVSLLINMIAIGLIIKIAALVIIFVAVCLFLLFKKRKLLLPIGIPSLIGIVAAMLLPKSYALVIIVALASYVLLDKLSLLLKIALFFALSLLVNAIIASLIIRIVVLVIGFALVAVTMIKEKEKSVVLNLVCLLIAGVLSIVLPINLTLAIAAALLVSYLIVTKVPSNFRPVAFIILFTTLLTWILPLSYFSNGELIAEGKTQLGLFDLFNYPSVVMSYFGNYFIYILIVGGFYGVLYKTGAFNTIVENISKKAKYRPKLTIALLIVIISALVSVCGVSFVILMIVPFVVALILLMGYDKFTAAMVSAGSISVGLMGNMFSSTFIASDYNMTAQNGAGVVNSIISSAGTTITHSTLWVAKLIILILGMALLIVSTIIHMSKTETTTKEEIEEYVPEVNKSNKKVKTWPLVVLFDLTVIVLLLAFTSWTSVFKVDFFSKATNFVLNTINISGFPIIGKILGGVKEFEQWGLVEASTLLVISSFVIGLIYKVDFKSYIDSFVKGAKKAFKPAVLVALIFTVLVIVSYDPITLTIMKPILALSAKFNVFTASLSAFIASVFNVDIYYIAENCLEYPVSLIKNLDIAEVQKIAAYKQMSVIWYSMYGFAALVAPTSVTLIAILSYLNIPYKKWLKSNWFFILSSLLMMMIVFIVTFIFLK